MSATTQTPTQPALGSKVVQARGVSKIFKRDAFQVTALDNVSIDIAAGERFLADHYDSFAKKVQPSERTLCGHADLSPRGIANWLEPYAPAGAVQNKVTSAALAARMSFTAALGHACGRNFSSAAHLARYANYEWYRPILRDMDARPWTEFRAK